MHQHIMRIIGVVVATTLLLALTGCTDWSTHKKWPKEYEFQGQKVQLHRTYLTGDYDTEDTAPGQDPALYHTYYAYEEGNKQIRHGKATWWYDTGKPKAEVMYVHGVKQSRTNFHLSGKVREKVLYTPEGEDAKFYDKEGRLVGRQLYDAGTGKRTYILRGKIVPLDDFMFEINRSVYGSNYILRPGPGKPGT
jgi:MORN repeat protein